MTKKKNITHDEKQEFIDAVSKKDTRIFSNDDRVTYHKPFCISENKSNCSGSYDPLQHIRWNNGQDEIQFHQAGVQPKLLKKLRLGKVRISKSLDLHGFNVDQAGEALNQFIKQSSSDEKQCVLVIHGKGTQSIDGRAILKNMIAGWLQSDTRVLAYSSAQPRHGGNGATYVLLKKKR